MKKMLKKLSSPKNGKKLICLIVSIIIITFITTLIYSKLMKNLTYHNVYKNISEISEQTSSGLNNSISNQMKFVNMIIDFIHGGYANTEEDIFKRFLPDLKNYHFTRLVILDESGNGITSDHHTITNYPNIKDFFQTDDIYLSENRPSTVENNQVNIYAKTFSWKGKKQVLFATINKDNYKEILSRRLFNGQGETYLINQKGEILIDSLEAKIPDNTILSDYLISQNNMSKKDQNKLKEMQQHILESKTGSFDVKFGHEVHFLHYEKININDWYVITIAPGSTIAKELTIFLGISIGISTTLILLIVIIFVAIYIINQRKNKKLYEIAYIDPITKLGNESYFKEKCQSIIINHKNAYIAMLDINKFKHFNKIYDYDFCNEILKSFGNVLKSKLPKENIVCRIRGDIFVSCFTYNGKIDNLINQLFKTLESVPVFTMKIPLSASVGLYKLTPEDKDINKILDKVDVAHEKAKGPYNSNYYFFDESLETALLEEEQIELNMEQALKNGEFQVYYQPKVYVKNGELAGAEALVRWQKENTLIPPNKFIPLFEKNKFIIKLDLYIFEQVCKNMQEWKSMFSKLPTISVNVSKEHFTDENFIDEYIKIADKYEINHRKIDLEITESATIDESIDIVKIINNIKKRNFMVSLDDFGVGYSSLGMLQQLNIDIIKIDKTFIDQANLKSDQNIINYISLMSQKMGVKTIVEGIEKEEQVKFIQKLECDMIQGYFYSKPIPKKDFEEYVKQYRK